MSDGISSLCSWGKQAQGHLCGAPQEIPAHRKRSQQIPRYLSVLLGDINAAFQMNGDSSFSDFQKCLYMLSIHNYRAFITMTTLLKPKSWHLAFYLINPNCCLLCAVLRVSQVSQWHSVEATGAAFFSCFLEFWNIGEWMRQSLVCWMPCSGGSVTGQASRPCLLSPCPGRAGVYVTFMSQKQTRIHNPASSQGFSFGFLICVFESQSWLKISAVLFSISPDCAKIIRGIFTFIASTFNLSLCRWQTQTYRIALLNVA